MTVVARLCDGRHSCGAVLVAARISPFPLKALQSVLIVQPAEVSIVGNGIGDAEIVLMVVEHDVGSFRKGIAALLTVLTGCFRKVEDAYGTINWESIVLIAAMKPMSTALEKTDVSAMMSSSLASTLGEMGPYALIAGIYFTTSFITMFISSCADDSCRPGGCTADPRKPLFVPHGSGVGGKHVLCLAILHAAKRIGDENRTLQVYRLCPGRTAFANYHRSGDDFPPAGLLAVLSEAGY